MVRPISPLQVNFKWSPVSIKSDFTRLSGANLPQQQGLPPNPAAFSRPKSLINHFEFHKELSRKDDLVTNLKT